MDRDSKIFWSITIISQMIFWVILISILGLCSCAPKLSAILPEGMPIEQDGSRILIIWKDSGDKPHSYAYNWVYLPDLGQVEDLSDYQAVIVLQKKSEPWTKKH